MPFNKPILQNSNPFKPTGQGDVVTRTIYYGVVVSVDDPYDGNRIKVRIRGLDNNISDEDLPWCHPLLPRYFFVLPQVGELVKVFLEDPKFPEKGRHWEGSIISQPHKIGFDSAYTAFSTTDYATISPEESPSHHPDADGVFPKKDDVAVIGKLNTDIILSPNQINIRAGKHENDNILKLNVNNPATISLNYEPSKDSDTYYSNTVIMSDKIAIITHEGNPKFKSARVEKQDRERIFDEGHPVARADVLVEALKIIRDALIQHIHSYSNMPADKTAIIRDLESINFDNILQKNIVIN